MISLDTNVVVRFLVQDDPRQSAAATAVIEALSEGDPGFVNLVTMVEIHRVLRRAYKVDVATCADLLERLATTRELRVGQPEVVRTALLRSRAGADFADAVIVELGRLAGCAETVTFDRGAAVIPGVRLLG